MDPHQILQCPHAAAPGANGAIRRLRDGAFRKQPDAK